MFYKSGYRLIGEFEEGEYSGSGRLYGRGGEEVEKWTRDILDKI